MNKLKNWLTNYRKKNSKLKIAGDIIFWFFLVLLIIPSTRKEISTFVNRVTMSNPKVSESEEYHELTDEDLNLRFMDYEGKTYRLGDFQGEVILLNYWATWCPPCRAEMPSIQKLYNEYGDKIRILLLSSENEETVNTYLSENEYILPVFRQLSPAPGQLAANAIPTTYLIDRNGNIRLEKTGAADWNSADFKAQLDLLIETQIE